ncbi:MAG: ferritin [Caldilineaceae bacterium]
MIINRALLEPLNAQIQSEFTASSQYVSIAVYFEDEALPDLAGYFFRQAEEERMHAMKFVHFMLDAGAKPIIPSTPEVRNDFEDAADAVKYALEQELKVTDQINNLVSIATAESDHITRNFLQWFVTEQVEEVDSMDTLLRTIEHANGNLLWVEDYVRRNAQAAAAAGPDAAA